MGDDWHAYLVQLVAEQRGVHERQRWELPPSIVAIEAALAEITRLRAVEETHAMLLRTVRDLPRPRPYYGSAIWHLDQALGDEATAAAPESTCDKPRYE